MSTIFRDSIDEFVASAASVVTTAEGDINGVDETLKDCVALLTPES